MSTNIKRIRKDASTFTVNDILYRRCPACLNTKILTTDNFHLCNTKNPYGFQSQCKKCQLDYSKNRDLDYKSRRLLLARIRKYGLTEQLYLELIEKQGNRCAVCKGSFEELKEVVDHCHQTGQIRGLLCDSCNRALGCLRDDPIRIQTLLQYLGDTLVYSN